MNAEHTEEMKTLERRTAIGFWLYLMTDCLLFATLFATYVVLQNATAGGSSARDLFDPPIALAETLILLTSSFTCGLAILAIRQQKKKSMLIWLAITYILGVAFLSIELSEFAQFVSEGHSWRASAFLSGFFTLVGTHGLHIFVGLLWLLTLVFAWAKRGFTPKILRQFTLFGLFWHFLDVVWIFIFTVVYLMGVA